MTEYYYYDVIIDQKWTVLRPISLINLITQEIYYIIANDSFF